MNDGSFSIISNRYTPQSYDLKYFFYESFSAHCAILIIFQPEISVLEILQYQVSPSTDTASLIFKAIALYNCNKVGPFFRIGASSKIDIKNNLLKTIFNSFKVLQGKKEENITFQVSNKLSLDIVHVHAKNIILSISEQIYIQKNKRNVFKRKRI